MSLREFEYSDAKSFKFWKIDLKGTDVLTQYGRIGTAGQETTKSFKTAADAKKARDKLIAEKLAKGYVETTKGGKPEASTPAKPAASPAATTGKSAAKAGKDAAKTEAAASESGPDAAGGRREFHFVSGNSSKFWAIELKGSELDVSFGRLGTAGTSQAKSFGSEQQARQNYEKLISEKTAKGYREKAAAASAAAAGPGGSGGELSPMMFNITRDADFKPVSTFVGERVTAFREGKKAEGKSVFRISVGWGDDGEDDADFAQLLQAFLDSDAALATKGLIVGSYDMEGGSSGWDWGALVKAKNRLPNLLALFLGDLMQEEAEISWIQSADVTPVLEAFPKLEMLRIRGASGLAFSKPRHERLRALAIESGGLPAAVVSQICRGEFPQLEYLELWLGTPDYQGDCRVNDLQPIFKGKRFPKLKYLGLRNAEIADEVAGVVATSPLVEQLEVLDLSLGNLSDVGGNALLQLNGLKRLDLHHHYLTKPVQKKLKQLPFPVDLSDEKTPEEGEFGGRFISVSE